MAISTGNTFGPVRDDYSPQSSNILSSNSASKPKASPFGKAAPHNYYKNLPEKRRPYAYAESPQSKRSEHNYDRYSKAASSFQVPLGSQRDASESGNEQTYISFNDPFKRKMTNGVRPYDEADEEIPDEETNVAEVISIHNSIVPRESITDNINLPGTERNSIRKTLNPGSVLEILHAKTTVNRKNILFSSNASALSSQQNPLDINQSSFNSRFEMQFFDQKNHRAVANWSRMYILIMRTYRKHRFNKILRNKDKYLNSASPKKRSAKKARNEMKIRLNFTPGRPKYKFYPCVRFLQRLYKAKRSRRIRNPIVPK